jgi:hypothetical protein
MLLLNIANGCEVATFAQSMNSSSESFHVNGVRPEMISSSFNQRQGIISFTLFSFVIITVSAFSV